MEWTRLDFADDVIRHSTARPNYLDRYAAERPVEEWGPDGVTVSFPREPSEPLWISVGRAAELGADPRHLAHQEVSPCRTHYRVHIADPIGRAQSELVCFAPEASNLVAAGVVYGAFGLPYGQLSRNRLSYRTVIDDTLSGFAVSDLYEGARRDDSRLPREPTLARAHFGASGFRTQEVWHSRDVAIEVAYVRAYPNHQQAPLRARLQGCCISEDESTTGLYPSSSAIAQEHARLTGQRLESYNDPRLCACCFRRIIIARAATATDRVNPEDRDRQLQLAERLSYRLRAFEGGQPITGPLGEVDGYTGVIPDPYLLNLSNDDRYSTFNPNILIAGERHADDDERMVVVADPPALGTSSDDEA